MAVEQSTASDYRDLLDRLRIFLTTNGTLVAAGQQWTTQRWSVGGTTQELILRAPGLSGADQVFVGITSYQDIPSDYFNWRVAGLTGFGSALSFDTQPGFSQYNQAGLHLWNTSIPYWFIANGRRAIIIVRINTRYFFLHIGLILPHFTPAQYPYPLCIFGNQHNPVRWSSVAGRYNYANILKGGSWRTADIMNSGTYEVKPTADNTYYLKKLTIMGQAYYDTNRKQYLATIYGDVQGMFSVPGVNNVSENIITAGGYNHLVVQDGSNTTLTSYNAFRLE